MEPFELHTERLLIRCPREGDGRLVYASVSESLTALREFPLSLPWAMEPPSLEASERFCREGEANFRRRTDMPMLLFLRASGAHVGNSGLHRFDWSVPKCELGFWLRTSYGGRGLMTEAAKALTAYALRELGMRRVQALTDEENLRARRVCERAGFTLQGTLRHYRASPDGIVRNACVYAIVR